MVRDGVANIVAELHRCGFEPHRVGHDSWEARCPVHKGVDRAIAITRNEFNHVMLECRGIQKCSQSRIIGALGFTIDRVYEETPDWLINRISRVAIEPASFEAARGQESQDEESLGLHRPNSQTVVIQTPSSPDAEESVLESRLPAAHEPKNKPEDDTPSDACAAETTPSPGSIECPPAQPVIGPASPSQAPEPSLNAISSDRRERQSPIQVLLRLTALARFFRSADGGQFAQVPVGSRHEIHGLKSAAFRDWLIAGYFAECSEIPSQAAIHRVLIALEARARFEGGTPSVFIRVGHDGAASDSPYYIDLGDSSGRAIKIGPEGWSIVAQPGAYFRRPEGLLALPTPEREGSISLLRSYVNMSMRDFRLLVVWLAAALRPLGPYPILALYGEQAAAKSTLARVVRLLIDPQAAPLLVIPRSTRNLMVTGHNGWLLAYDNISSIGDLVSDGLCMMSTGGAYAGRALFSNDERSVIQVQRPVILSGIEEFVRRADLGDRCVYIDLPAIDDDDRRREDQFWPAFHQDQPKILGGLLDLIVGGLRELPSINLRKLPRMADFAAFGEAVGRTLGWPAGKFLADYSDNRREATASQLEDSLVATLLLENAHRMGDWTGTPSELLAQMGNVAGKKVAASARWPKSPAWLTNELRRIAPQLRMNGLSITFERNRVKRLVTLTKCDSTGGSGWNLAEVTDLH